jgi:hypothetical protein
VTHTVMSQLIVLVNCITKYQQQDVSRLIILVSCTTKYQQHDVSRLIVLVSCITKYQQQDVSRLIIINRDASCCWYLVIQFTKTISRDIFC